MKKKKNGKLMNILEEKLGRNKHKFKLYDMGQREEITRISP